MKIFGTQENSSPTLLYFWGNGYNWMSKVKVFASIPALHQDFDLLPLSGRLDIFVSSGHLFPRSVPSFAQQTAKMKPGGGLPANRRVMLAESQLRERFFWKSKQPSKAPTWTKLSVSKMASSTHPSHCLPLAFWREKHRKQQSSEIIQCSDFVHLH